MSHPLLRSFHDAARGAYVEADGDVTYLPPLDDGREAVVAFTGHSVIASRLGAADLGDLDPDGFGGALAPAVLLRLAAGGTIGVNDVTMVAPGTGGADSGAPRVGALRRTDRWDDHPRVRHARTLRADVEVFGDEHGLVTLGRGLAGRLELSIEVDRQHHGSGLGRALIGDARSLVPAGLHVFAAVSPGNARSLRSFLAAGFTPIASEVIVDPFDHTRAVPR